MQKANVMKRDMQMQVILRSFWSETWSQHIVPFPSVVQKSHEEDHLIYIWNREPISADTQV